MANRPDPAPLQTNDVALTAGGTVLWVVALVVLVVLKVGGTDVHGWWIGMCGYGIALGLLGVRTTSRRRRALPRD